MRFELTKDMILNIKLEKSLYPKLFKKSIDDDKPNDSEVNEFIESCFRSIENLLPSNYNKDIVIEKIKNIIL